MARREGPAGRTKRAAADKSRDPRVTDQSIAAGTANLAAGRAKKRQETQAAHERGDQPAGKKWRQLLAGEITVADLDDVEVSKMRVRGRDGGFAGRSPKVPNWLAQEFRKESLRRATEKFRQAAADAVQGLIDIAQDPDAKDSDRIKAYDMIINRALGKTPEVVRVEGMSAFDKMLSEAVGLDRELSDEEVER